MTKIKNFDYIVCGAGTAGGIIAKELTDDKKTSVLVLEEGTNLMNTNPSAVAALTTSSTNEFSILRLASPTPNIGTIQIRQATGRAIGGSSEHNIMYAVRGSRELYDGWADLVGEQWSYDEVSPLFQQNETYTGQTQNKCERGKDGPIFIRQQMVPKGGLTEILSNAASTALNIPKKEDYNTGISDVTSPQSQFFQEEIDGGEFIRSSVATGYLNETIVTQATTQFEPDEFGVDGRKLVIFGKTLVNKILFKRKKGVNVAIGVEFVRDGVSQRAFARKGCIISAGNFSSTILERSGIGDPCVLAEAGITPLVANSQVGRNYQSHFFSGMGVELKTERILEVLNADPDQPILMATFKAQKVGESRRLQMIGSPYAASFVPDPNVIANGWGLDLTKEFNVISFGLLNLRPDSRGCINITHSNPETTPNIQFNPLDQETDLEFMVDSYIDAFNVMVEARKLDPEGMYEVVYPPERIFELPDKKKREMLRTFVRASYDHFNHAGGQCRMDTNIQKGVVDGFLDVFGTKNLKVADLSICPDLADGNTSNCAMMIGLNASRFIKDDDCSYVLDDREFDCYEE